MRFEHDPIAYLHENGFPAPSIVPSANGDTCAAVTGCLYSVSVFVRGSGCRAGTQSTSERPRVPWRGIIYSKNTTPTSRNPHKRSPKG
jgi:hypothetical protein